MSITSHPPGRSFSSHVFLYLPPPWELVNPTGSCLGGGEIWKVARGSSPTEVTLYVSTPLGSRQDALAVQGSSDRSYQVGPSQGGGRRSRE